MIESALLTRLLGDATVVALVADRITPAPMPQASVLPALTYQRISRRSLISLDGTTGPYRPRIQIDSWAKKYVDAKALAAAVEASLNGFRGNVDGQEIRGIFLDNDQDLYEDDVKLHRVRSDYFVWHVN